MRNQGNPFSGMVPDEIPFKSVLSGLGIAVAVIDREFRYLHTNPNWLELFGYSPSEIGGMSVLDILPPDDVESACLELQRVLDGAHSFLKTEKQLIRKDRTVFWGDIVLTPWMGSSGQIDGVIASLQDISEKRILKDEILNLKNLYAGSAQVHQLLLRRPDLPFLFREVVRIGVTHGGFVAAWINLIDPDTQELLKVALSTSDPQLEEMLNRVEISVNPEAPSGMGSVGESVRTGKPSCINDFLINPRTAFWRERAEKANIRSVASFPLHKQDKVVGAMVVLSDREGAFQGEIVSLLSEMAESLSFGLEDSYREEQRSIAATVFNEALEGILILDPTGRIIMVNPVFSEVTGVRPEEVVGRSLSVICLEWREQSSYAQLWESLEQTGKWQGEIWNRRENGMEYLLHLSIVGARNRDAGLSHYIGFLTDITSRREEENRIRKLAYHDPLTGLANRTLLQDRLEQAIRTARRTGNHVGLVYLDLDSFKPINDRFGHQAGDDLLREISFRLGSILRESDTVCRVGGDEFVLLFPELPGAEELLHLGSRVVLEVARPFGWEDSFLCVSASVGLALFPEDGEDVLSLLFRADRAMYQAKKSGKNRFFWKT
ncbi:MAG: sensor domain-containing diguanylate cyclase [Leptospirales bacterium]